MNVERLMIFIADGFLFGAIALFAWYAWSALKRYWDDYYVPKMEQVDHLWEYVVAMENRLNDDIKALHGRITIDCDLFDKRLKEGTERGQERLKELYQRIHDSDRAHWDKGQELITQVNAMNYRLADLEEKLAELEERAAQKVESALDELRVRLEEMQADD